jgi:DNA-binding CsgD family transcriptional regulator
MNLRQLINHPPGSENDTGPGRSVLLNARDNAIVELLAAGVSEQRIAAIGVYRKMWTVADIDRIVALYTGTPTEDPNRVPWRPQGHQRQPQPFSATPPRVVELPLRQVEVLDGLCRGQDFATIAEDLGVSLRSVRGFVAALVKTMGAEDPFDAVSMARHGEVRIFIVDRRGGRPVTARAAA